MLSLLLFSFDGKNIQILQALIIKSRQIEDLLYMVPSVHIISFAGGVAMHSMAFAVGRFELIEKEIKTKTNGLWKSTLFHCALDAYLVINCKILSICGRLLKTLIAGVCFYRGLYYPSLIVTM
jgi:hypothetical protein